MSGVLELLRKVVRGQTKLIGEPVRNLIGPVPELAESLRVTREQRWLAMAVSGKDLLTVEEFYAIYTSSLERQFQTLVAVEGVVTLDADLPEHVHLVRATAYVPDATVVPLAVVPYGAQDEYGVYVDGTLLRRASGEREIPLALSAGRHTIEVVLATQNFALAVPPTLQLTVDDDRLSAPRWATVEPGYVDPYAGTPGVRLTWFTDVRAGGWSLQRRTLTPYGRILNLSEPDNNNEVSLTIEGNVTTVLPANTTAYAGFDLIGIVRQVSYDSTNTVEFGTETITGFSILRVRLSAAVLEPSVEWLGRDVAGGVFAEIARIQRVNSNATVSWIDAAVQTGQNYEYVLQSYGLFNPATVSPPSEARFVRAGDVEPPGSIIVADGYPSSINGRVSVVFHTPVDPDYDGVRTIFVEDRVVSATSPGGSTSSTFVLATAPTETLTGATITITSGTGTGQTATVITSAIGDPTVVVSPAWVVVPDATSGYSLQATYQVLTDYGLPDTDDQFSFVRLVQPDGTARVGTYYFVTFDKSGNEQDPADGVAWVYDPTTDGFLGENQPPVLSIRQLLPAEQAALVPDVALGDPPYNDTLNYAVVELSAYDPVDGTDGVTLEYRRRDILAQGLSTGGNNATTFNTSLGLPPNGLVNYRCSIVNGLGDGQDPLIASNTSNQITVSEPFTIIPDGTSEYEITWIGGIAATAPAIIDRPRLDRGRLMWISRAENSNWLGIRARDKDGLLSTELSYVPDYDNTPEFSTVETRIGLDGAGQWRCFVTGAVDDDTRSIEWWVEPASAGEGSASAKILIAPLSTRKDFTFDFSVPDGVVKMLFIRPWSGEDGTGTEGIDFQREIVRAPRTTLLVENRDANGQASAVDARLTFRVSPTIGSVDWSGSTIRTINSATDTTILDTLGGFGNYTYDNTTYNWYFVEMISGQAEGKVRRIISNDGTTLVTEQWSTPDEPTPLLPQAGDQFRIRRGATYWRKRLRAEGSEVLLGENTPWRITLGREYIKRDEKIDGTTAAAEIVVEFYSVLTGVPPEELKATLIDPDDLAEIETWSVSENPGGYISVKLGLVDDDTRRWQLYAKKGGWPTTTTAASEADALVMPVDPDFLRVDLPITTTREASFAVGNGTWYLILVPINSFGQAGARKATTIVIDGVTDGTGALGNFNVTPVQIGGAWYHKVGWSTNDVIETSTGWNVDVTRLRSDLPNTAYNTAALCTKRDATFDVGGDGNNGNDSDTVANEGSVLDAIDGLTYDPAGPYQYTWNYTAVLRPDYAGTVPPTTPGFTSQVRQYATSFTGRYSSTEPALTGAITATLINGGTCNYAGSYVQLTGPLTATITNMGSCKNVVGMFGIPLLWQYTNGTYYVVQETDVPFTVTLAWQNLIGFDATKHMLYVTTACFLINSPPSTQAEWASWFLSSKSISAANSTVVQSVTNPISGAVPRVGGPAPAGLPVQPNYKFYFRVAVLDKTSAANVAQMAVLSELTTGLAFTQQLTPCDPRETLNAPNQLTFR